MNRKQSNTLVAASALLAMAVGFTGCTGDPSGPSFANSLEESWQVTGLVKYGSGWYRSSDYPGAPQYRDTYWQCDWSMTIHLSQGGDGAVRGSYDNAVFQCEGSPWDGLGIPAVGAVTNVLLGALSATTTHDNFSMQLESPDETDPYPLVLNLDALFSPPDRFYGGARWAAQPHECGGEGTSCSWGEFSGVRDRLGEVK